MYKTVMLDGKEIKIRINVTDEDTGICILPDLNDTDDLSNVVKYIEESESTDDEDFYE